MSQPNHRVTQLAQLEILSWLVLAHRHYRVQFEQERTTLDHGPYTVNHLKIVCIQRHLRESSP